MPTYQQCLVLCESEDEVDRACFKVNCLTRTKDYISQLPSSKPVWISALSVLLFLGRLRHPAKAKQSLLHCQLCSLSATVLMG
jgi:hypothetical protein